MLKFGREFDHVTADTVQWFKVKGSEIKIDSVTLNVTRIIMFFTSTEHGSTIAGRCREMKSDGGRRKKNIE